MWVITRYAVRCVNGGAAAHRAIELGLEPTAHAVAVKGMRARQRDNMVSVSVVENGHANDTDVGMVDRATLLSSPPEEATWGAQPPPALEERDARCFPHRAEVVALAEAAACACVRRKEVLDGEAGEADAQERDDAVKRGER